MSTSPDTESSPPSTLATFTAPEQPSTTSAASGDKGPKKTKRIQLSCTACRHRKLKCNRLHPCENCIKRGQAQTCHYANPGPKKGPAHARLSARNNELQDRLVHLEELVVSLSSRNSDSPEAIVAAIQARQASPRPRDATDETEGDSPGRMVTDSSGTRYVDSSHWRAMLDEIAQVKEYLVEEEEEFDGEDEEDDICEPHHNTYAANASAHGVPKLLGAVPNATRSELLSGIPSRPVADQLVTRWFSGKEPGLICIHIPTFMKEYDQFWKEPRQTPTAWISILYSIIWLGTNFFVRTGESPPTDVPADPNDLLDFYLQRVVQAIILMDFTAPGKHKVEALLLYFGCEYLRYRDAQVGLTFIIAITNRLAMLSGYHRDPKLFPALSPYEGEMRRRTWALFRQVETLIAFQVGLPRLIFDWQTDTEAPRNLQYEDFDEDTKVLPPSRPESERTPVTYQIAKGRMMDIFGQIADRTFSREKISYDEVMVLDMRAREAHDALPVMLRIKALNLCLTDHPELVMQRYNLQFLFQKTRCVLHRRFFTPTAVDPRSVYSKRVCIEAALEILKHQKDLYDATQPGGILRHDSWYISSLTTHDFIMASMILCLWLSRERTNQEPEAARISIDSKQLFRALEGSYQIWTSLKGKSYEAYKAADALAMMLKKTRARRRSEPSSAVSDDVIMQTSTNIPKASPTDGVSNSFQTSTDSSSLSQGTPGTASSWQTTNGVNGGPLDNSAFGMASDTLMNQDLNLDMDWASWDLRYINQNTNADLGDMSWMNDADFNNLQDLDFGQVSLNGNGIKGTNGYSGNF